MFVARDDASGLEAGAVEVERQAVTFGDVGGLADVKERLEVAFLASLRNPQLRVMYRKQLRSSSRHGVTLPVSCSWTRSMGSEAGGHPARTECERP
jgi:hypothetical protein